VWEKGNRKWLEAQDAGVFGMYYQRFAFIIMHLFCCGYRPKTNLPFNHRLHHHKAATYIHLVELTTPIVCFVLVVVNPKQKMKQDKYNVKCKQTKMPLFENIKYVFYYFCKKNVLNIYSLQRNNIKFHKIQ
jgi:hypothetical protein